MTAPAAIVAPRPGLQAPTTVRPIITWPQFADILDERGRYLTTAKLPSPPVGSILPMADVDDAATLLHYVFGQGQRTVLLTVNGEPITSWLGTGWEGGQRTWWLELDITVSD